MKKQNALQRWLAAPFLLVMLAAAAPVYTPAPVPHEIEQLADSSISETSIRPHLFSELNADGFRGDGFVPGSTIQATEEARWVHPLPGVNIMVPIQ